MPGPKGIFIPFTREQAARFVVKGLAAQGWRRAQTTGGACILEDAHGRRCAYGQFLPLLGMEAHKTTASAARRTVEAIIVRPDGEGLGGELPGGFAAHDKGKTPREMWFRYRTVFDREGWPLPPELEDHNEPQ